jgi:hypothetical protein
VELVEPARERLNPKKYSDGLSESSTTAPAIPASSAVRGGAPRR